MKTYLLSIADFYRFMCGWSGGFRGNHQWAEQKTNELLDKIDNNEKLNEEEYELAI